MIGICVKCRKLRNTHLPSGHDPDWLNRPHPPIEWYCAACYWENIDTITKQPIEIDIHKHYLMPYRAVVPFLGSIAFIIMLCLEIAWHS